MVDICKCYTQWFPASRFIGIKYGEEDRIDGGFGQQWGTWFEEGRFPVLERLLNEDYMKSYEDAPNYIGLMRWKDNEPFQYWIGMFMPPDSQVPEGYRFVDLPEAKLGVCWLQGPEYELYGQEEKCGIRLRQEGYEVVADEEGAWWFFERYGCPRFTKPDEQNRRILDICHFVK